MTIIRKFAAALAPLAAALTFAIAPTSASAAHTVYICDPTLVTPTAVDCSGYYDGNVLGGNAGKIAIQIAAINELGASYVFDGNWGPVEDTKILTLTGGNLLDFGMMLYGETIIAAHFGNVAGPAGNVTAFYLFDFGTTGASSVMLNNTQGFSNAVLYTTGAVPEPAMWMLMILAFGAVGFAMRKRGQAKGSLALA